MWKLFALLSILAALRLWKIDHGVLAGLSALSGIMVFWSAGLIDNYAKTGKPIGFSSRWVLSLSLNLIGTLAATGFAAAGFILKP